MNRADEPLSSRTLAAFLEGEVTRSEAEQIEAKLRDCAISRRRLERVQGLRLALSQLPDELDPADLAAGVRHAIASAPPDAHVRSTPMARLSLVAAVALVVSLSLLLWPRASTDVVSETFRTKAASTTSDVADRWVGIDVFRVVTGGAQRLTRGGSLRMNDELVFRYTNVGSEPFGYLLVFGIDAARDVHWYYPAYITAGKNPSSIAIRAGAIAVPLPDAVQHEFAAGPLVIYGVFSHEPVKVAEIEHWVSAMIARNGLDTAEPPRLPVAGSGQDVMRVNVIR